MPRRSPELSTPVTCAICGGSSKQARRRDHGNHHDQLSCHGTSRLRAIGKPTEEIVTKEVFRFDIVHPCMETRRRFLAFHAKRSDQNFCLAHHRFSAKLKIAAS